jgi:hypothetical protein
MEFWKNWLLLGLLWVAIVSPIVHWAAYRKSRFSKLRAEYREDDVYIGDDYFLLLYIVACLMHALIWPYSIVKFISRRIKELKQQAPPA